MDYDIHCFRITLDRDTRVVTVWGAYRPPGAVPGTSKNIDEDFKSHEDPMKRTLEDLFHEAVCRDVAKSDSRS